MSAVGGVISNPAGVRNLEERSPFARRLVAIGFFADEQFAESQTYSAQNDGYFVATLLVTRLDYYNRSLARIE